MVDERGHAASPRDEPFADDVDVVDVEVRQVGNQRVGRVLSDSPMSLPSSHSSVP